MIKTYIYIITEWQHNSYHQHGVIPDVISQEPPNQLDLTFEDNIVTPAQIMTTTETSMCPLISFNAESDKYYTLICVDPDAPNRKMHLFRNWLHYIVVNIPGDNIEQGNVICKYSGPEPPKNSGLHRYIFLVYQQANGQQQFNKTYPDKGTSLSRSKFNVNKFIKQYQCEKLIAANFFLSENEKNKKKKSKNDKVLPQDEENEDNTLDRLRQKNTGSLM